MSLDLLGQNLMDAGDRSSAEAVFREGQRRHPGDVWLNYDLANCLESLDRGKESIRYYMAARSLRPETSLGLAQALEKEGEPDEALAIYRDLARFRPKDICFLSSLGRALQKRGRTSEAEAVLDAAIAASREAIGANPAELAALFNGGLALQRRGKLRQAVDWYCAGLRLKPDEPSGHYNLGNTLKAQGKLEEAIVEYREALRLAPISSRTT